MSFYKNNPNNKSSNNNNNNNKYNDKLPSAKLPLKSINGRRCLTKCYPKGETFLHPVLLTGIRTDNANSCAIDPIHSNEHQYIKENELVITDKCKLEDNKIFKTPNELESILLSFYFNPSDFLANIYGLKSFDDVIYWTTENEYLPFGTIKRVHNCAWKVYGNKIEDLSTNVLDFYYDISRYHWLKDYVKVIEKKYSFDLSTSEKKSTDIIDGSDEIYNIIFNKYFTYEFFVDTIKRYIYEYEDKWDIIDSHYGHIKKYIFEQLIENIEAQLTKK